MPLTHDFLAVARSFRTWALAQPLSELLARAEVALVADRRRLAFDGMRKLSKHAPTRLPAPLWSPVEIGLRDGALRKDLMPKRYTVQAGEREAPLWQIEPQ